MAASLKQTSAKLLGVIAGLAVVSTLTYGYVGFDHSIAKTAGRDERHLAGCASWCNVYTCNMNSCSDCATCTSSSPSCLAWCNRYTCNLSWCSGCGFDVGCLPAGVPRCDPWCNIYTCGSQFCEGCNSCILSELGLSCASWCNEWTSQMDICTGCNAGAGIGDYDLNPTIPRQSAGVRAADTSGKAIMMWDRMQAEEKTNMYGRLLDNFAQHCEVDSLCFGDLFADNGWVCSVDFFDVAFPHPEFSEVHPGAPALSSGKTIGGPACTADMGSTTQADINAAFQPIYGQAGVYQNNGHQPRHTVNNFVVTQQDATTMTTQHYQIIERYFRFETEDVWVGYDGSGYTVQIKWIKEGTGYTGLWKMTQMVQVHQGDGHLGLPPDSSLPEFQAFINGQRAVGGLSTYQARRELAEKNKDTLSRVQSKLRRELAETEVAVHGKTQARRKLSNWKPPPRKLQGTFRYGDIDPLKTHIPNPTSDSEAVQMAWDREEMLERISMYSWLADETRTNILEGFAWGDLYAEGGMWCAYTTGATFDWPNFDDYTSSYTFEGRGVGGGPCGQDAPLACINSCTPFMGGYSQNILQTMITSTFGAPSAATARYQQTRHTLTNKIFLDQTLTTAKTWVYNTLERFIKGVAYDNSFFMYQHEWIKQAGVWKWAKIAAFTQGHGHLGGLPPLSEWDPWMVGVNGYAGSTGFETRIPGRQLQTQALGGDGYATHVPIGPVTTSAPNIQLNPRVNRVPIAATAALSNGDVGTAATMLWDRLEITERLNMYPWLADERRRNGPLGFRWGDLYGDDVYFCQFNYFDVTEHRPTWDELVPGYAGAFGIPQGTSSPVATSCETGGIPAPYAQSGMQALTNGFGFNGVFQEREQQTRHTFSNYIFLMQTVDSAATLNYNIVERYVNGIAMDGSNFLYHMNWSKIGGRWYSMNVKVLHFGDDRLSPVPTPDAFATWLTFIRSSTFI